MYILMEEHFNAKKKLNPTARDMNFIARGKYVKEAKFLKRFTQE